VSEVNQPEHPLAEAHLFLDLASVVLSVGLSVVFAISSRFAILAMARE
jgi:hypothetical protein